ncbi:DUF2796 domain-containing protein [Ruegeria sp. HKCCD7255]|uniref:ZrgA family zinc uptake protein n=1 Tax=Ruegeria sp. HKCCD7255 TaxID=2683004 RepID=UPI001487CAA1|nr:DUF2796 domain-containing protein [Ruegeria sp. HKCCD7255]
MKRIWFALICFPTTESLAQSAPGSEIWTPGVGHLAIEFSGSDFLVTLKAPGDAIVGFDHPARSDEERAQVAAAVSELSKPETVLAIPYDAGCTAWAANVVLNGDAFGKGLTVEPDHLEIRAEYHFRCDAVDALTTMQFPFFSHFPSTNVLRADVKLKTGERAFEIKRTEPVLVFE